MGATDCFENGTKRRHISTRKEARDPAKFFLSNLTNSIQELIKIPEKG
jgi:hypothetical protein